MSYPPAPPPPEGQPDNPYGQPSYGQQPPAYGQPSYGTPPPPYGGGPAGYGGGGGGYGPPPPNYLVWAILSTIFCCLPFGIASIVFAAQVNSKWAAGDVQGAQDSSRKARLWALLSVGAFFVIIVLYVIAAIAVAAGSSTSP